MQKRFLSLFAALVTACAFPLTSDARDIVFIGDSITQGGSYLSGPVASWRYSLFKHFVDDGEEFFPMGMTNGARGNVDVSSLCPPYRGKAFTNVSEAAASGRSYQYSGHPAEGKFRTDPGVVFPPENRGPVTIKLGQKDPFTKSADEFFDGTTRKKYTGETYRSRYGDRKPDTLCVLIGINDLYDAREDNAAIAEHVHGIVKAFQKHNPKIRVHVFELLPTGKDNGTGTTGKNNYIPYNAYLRGVVRKWSTASSKVSLDRVSDGFYAESGAMIDTSRGAHPNRQGELIVAGNVARALGLSQRSAGLERRENAKLSESAENLSAGKFSRKGSGVSVSGDRATFKTGDGEGTLSFSWNKRGKAREFTLAFSAKLDASGKDENALAVVVGNGTEAGELSVREEGIFWNNALLYGADTLGDKVHNSFSTTKEPVALRVAWLDGNAKSRAGVPSGFYVWLGDQLIGEALSADKRLAVHCEKILFGDLGSERITRATLSGVRFCAGKPYAPAKEK